MTDNLALIDTVPIMGRSVIAHDPDNRLFPVRGAVVNDAAPRISRSWSRSRKAYDQGATSSCVGQTFRGILDTLPARSQVPNSVRSRYDGLNFYRGGQTEDEWPGQEPSYFGTSALGVCKYLKLNGIINEYRWCFGLNDVLDTLSQHGPVGVGLNWTEAMMTPDEQGFIVNNGSTVGGHETELLGVNFEKGHVIGINSWGPSWGVKGRFKIKFDVLDALLKNQGDAVTVTSVVKHP